MTLEEIISDQVENVDEILEQEYQNIIKANTNIPYRPTEEYENLLDELSETVTDPKIKRYLKEHFNQEIATIDMERTMFSYEFSEHFDDREKRVKTRISNLI